MFSLYIVHHVQWSLWSIPVVKVVTELKTKKYKKLLFFQKHIRNNAKGVMHNTYKVIKKIKHIFVFDNSLVSLTYQN